MRKDLDRSCPQRASASASCAGCGGSGGGTHKSPYDAVAREYAQTFADELAHKPFDREMLRRFARLVPGRRPVCDLGCGPGQTTACLSELGVTVYGVDISRPLLVEARRLHTQLEFAQGDMLSLPFADGSLGGIVAFYAIVHFSREELAAALGEMARVLHRAGALLLSFHIGDETIHVGEFLGKRVSVDFVFFPTDEVVKAIAQAGMVVAEVVERDPYPEVEYQSRRAYVFARKAGDHRVRS